MAKTIEERRADHADSAAKAKAQAETYRGRAAAYRIGGKIDKAEKCEASAERFDMRASSHERQLEDLQGKRYQDRVRQETGRVARAESMRKAQERAAEEAERIRNDPTLPLRIYMEALDHAAELDGEAHQLQKKAQGYRRAGEQSKAERTEAEAGRRQGYAVDWRQKAQEAVDNSGRDLAREREVSLKAARRKAAADAKEAQRLAHMGALDDSRTRGGSREYMLGGPKGERVTSMAAFSGLLARPQDRTPRRLEAMERFEKLCGQAEAGLIPEPRFEAESHGSGGAGMNAHHARIAGLLEMDDLREAIGPQNVDMLRLRIFERQSLGALLRDGFGTEKTIAALVVAAIDAMAAFFKTGDMLAARLAGNGISVAPPPNRGASPNRAAPARGDRPNPDRIRAQRY